MKRTSQFKKDCTLKEVGLKLRRIYCHGVTYEKLQAYLTAFAIAEFDGERGCSMQSVHFPVGRYPQLYEEDALRGHVTSVEEPGAFRPSRPPRFRSRYSLPLQRGTWIAQARRKPSMSSLLVSV